ncbi:MAG: hemolysin family protein [Pseudomonadota bacterium]
MNASPKGLSPEPQSTSLEVPADAEDPRPSSDGLLSRLIGAFSPSDTPDTSQSLAPNGTAEGIFALRQMRVQDVAIPKVEITAVPADTTLEELVSTFRESGKTRLPVYDGTLDQPMGLVHLKDLALRHGFNGQSTFDLASMLRPLIYAPPSMPIDVLLQKMQSERMHMALVIDEYGGVDGLATIEDLIETVIGEIEDEHDVDEDALWFEEKPGLYVALAKTPLEDFEKATGTSLTSHEDVDEEDIGTLGGLVFMLSGRVPLRGEVVAHPSGPEFEVVDADPRRVKRLRVRIP